LRYIAFRLELAQSVGMGIHRSKSIELPSPRQLQQIQINVWQVAGRTMVAAVGVYDRAEDGSVIRTNIGADILDYRIFDLPTLPQIIFALGDEVRAGYKELSHPKA
jgi:hypothetical protein